MSYRDLYEMVAAGGDLEMPRGLAMRLDAAGYRHPAAGPSNNVPLLEAVACTVFDMDVDEDETNAAVAGLLFGAGVAR